LEGGGGEEKGRGERRTTLGLKWDAASSPATAKKPSKKKKKVERKGSLVA